MLLSGGCACQSIRYECTEKPIVQLICHCRDCQRASGSAFAAVMMVATDKFRFLKEEPAYHEVIGGSGRSLRRGFCAKCGTPVTANWPEMAAVKIIQVGSLDDPSCFEPQTEPWLSSGYSWHPVNPSTLKFECRPITGVKDRLDAYFASRATP
jgi:hypothetical protein